MSDPGTSNPQVDVVFLGMYDLSASLGHAGDFQHPSVEEAVERVISSGRAHNKVIGMYVADAEAARRWFTRGVTFFETSSEVDLIAQGACALVRKFRAIGA